MNWYIVLTALLAIFVFMWVRDRHSVFKANKRLLSDTEAYCKLEKVNSDLRLQVDSHFVEPIPVKCMLHGQFKGFAANVIVNRNGELSAPDRLDDRVLFRNEGDCVLGAPQWSALTNPLKYGTGYWGNDLIVLNMLGAPYIMKHGDLAELNAQK